MARSLRHDIMHHNHYRGLRTMALFLAEFPNVRNVAIRVFYILRSLCGEPVLGTNAFGSIQEGVHINSLILWQPHATCGGCVAMVNYSL